MAYFNVSDIDCKFGIIYRKISGVRVPQLDSRRVSLID